MASKKYPVVLRFEGMDPSDIGGYEAHRTRRGGDLGHVDPDKPAPRRLLGTETWAQEALAEIALMKIQTFAAELDDLDRRNRRKDLAKRNIEGPRDPWRASRHGPMRELILTANKEWFEHTETSDEMFNTAREQQFEKRAVEWLKDNFGDDVIHARADIDEQAYHIHAVIMPRATVRKYGTECRVGPVVGALVLSAISEVLSSKATQVAGLFFGVVVVVAVVLMPRGLADLARHYRKTGWRYFAQNIRRHRI